MVSDVVLIIPLLIAIGMVVGQGAGGRKQGRGSFDQEVKHHLLLRHTPQNPTTFPYIPSLTFSILSRTPPCTTRAPWAGKGALCCRCGEPGNPTPVSQSRRTILHNSTQTLHLSACLAILQLSAAILHFPAIHLKFGKTC